MSRDMNDLEAGFRPQAEQLLAACLARGYEMRPYFTLRTALEQAKLWRQSRTGRQIADKITELEQRGAPFLASVLGNAGPQNGPHVTNALPGLSWHQWGEAMDCFWVVDGQAEWGTRRKINGFNGYKIYAQEAENLGITAGGHWTSFKDWPHVQQRAESNPGRAMSLAEIDDKMRERFG